MLTLCTIPQTFEALTLAFVAYGLFNMPFSLCFALAYAIACISPSVMIPGLISLMERGYGHEKGINAALIAAGTFDDILCIIFFQICKAVAFSDYNMLSGQPMSQAVGMVFLENAVGLVVGLVMGVIGLVFNKVPHPTLQMHLKMWYCIGLAIAYINLGTTYSSFSDTKYIASLTTGYVCSRVWGDAKPTKELGYFWWFIQPLFFGCVGAALVFKQLTGQTIGYAIVCILCGIIVRIATVVIMTSIPGDRFTSKERAFTAFAWLPKATVQAAQASVILVAATSAKNDQMIEYGIIIQTTAIFSIVICAPIGAVLIQTFGPKYLQLRALPTSSDKKAEEDLHSQPNLALNTQ